MSDNPYTPSGSAYGNINPDTNVDMSQAELIRTSHLSHEANIQSLGCLYLLGGIGGAISGVAYVAIGIGMLCNLIPAMEDQPQMDATVAGVMQIGIGVVTLAMSFLQLYAGRTMQTLNASGKIAAIIVSVFSLFGCPCIGIFALYLLLSSKGEMIYSPQYKEIVQATPHIRYKTSIVVWILLFILLGLVAFGIIAALVSGR
ncbi:MAG: hypothetical protein ACKO3V_13460 [Pirellula sp.]